LIGNEPNVTEHSKIMKSNEEFLEIHLIEKILEKIKETIKTGQVTELLQVFVELDIGYKHSKQM
jgi:hypothetical protein